MNTYCAYYILGRFWLQRLGGFNFALLQRRGLAAGLSVLLLLLGFTVPSLNSAESETSRPEWKISFTLPVPGEPKLNESVWTLERPPYDGLNRIGLRLVYAKNGPYKGALVYLPPAGFNGKLYTGAQEYDFRLYLAKRGWQVFSLDFRPAFLPPRINTLSLTGEWGTNMFLNDVEQGTAFAKKVAGEKQVFLMGALEGGRLACLYASRHQPELRGLITLDSGPWKSYGHNPKNSLNLEDARRALRRGDSLPNRRLFESWGVKAGPLYYEAQLFSFHPGFREALQAYRKSGSQAKSPVSGYKTAGDFLAGEFYTVWGPGKLSNLRAGYGEVKVLAAYFQNAGLIHWPVRPYLEDAYIGNWGGAPPEAELNFQRDFTNLSIPALALNSGPGDPQELQNLAGLLKKNRDFKSLRFSGFGELDLLLGSRAESQVFVPLYAWLGERNLLRQGK